jgi:hypothetical protein
MATFLDRALSTADLERACEAADVGMGDYLRGRRTDPAFAADCAELDLVLRLAMQHAIVGQAARGDRQAARMVARGDLEIRDSLEATYEPLPSCLDDIVNDARAGRIPAWTLDALGRFYSALRGGRCEASAEVAAEGLREWSSWDAGRWEDFAIVTGALLTAESSGVFPLWLVERCGLVFGDPLGSGHGVVIVGDDGRPVAYTDESGDEITTGRESVAAARPGAFFFPMDGV